MRSWNKTATHWPNEDSCIELEADTKLAGATLFVFKRGEWSSKDNRVYGRPISASLVNPGDGHPLWRSAHLLEGFLQFLKDFIHAVIDQREVKVVSVLAADGLRVLLQLL